MQLFCKSLPSSQFYLAMKFVVCGLVVAFICICVWADEHSEQSNKSERPKVHKDELSDKEHFPDGEHSSEYDHEAFLGDQKQEFDELSPEEAKKRLKKLVPKVDKNSDSFITVEELHEWVKGVFDKKVYEGVETDLQEKDVNKDGAVSWEEYVKVTFGESAEDKEKGQDNEVDEFLKRDKRRFESADKDKDGKLDQKEFVSFVHPESSPDMSELHILETLEGKLQPPPPPFNGEAVMVWGEGGDQPWAMVKDKNYFSVPFVHLKSLRNTLFSSLCLYV